jgi:hypothetical protein
MCTRDVCDMYEFQGGRAGTFCVYCGGYVSVRGHAWSYTTHQAVFIKRVEEKCENVLQPR